MPNPLRQKRTSGEATPSADATVDAAHYQAASRLFDSLLHDARNPLNALAINLDVLAEKIKLASNGAVPAPQAKNLTVMREQIFRVDAVLRQFSEYLAPHPGHGGEVDLSETVQRAVDLLAYESRRCQVRIHASIGRGIRLKTTGANSARSIIFTLLRGLLRARSGSDLEASLIQDGTTAVLSVKDGRPEKLEPLPDVPAALEALASRGGGAVEIRPGEATVTFSEEEIP